MNPMLYPAVNRTTVRARGGLLRPSLTRKPGRWPLQLCVPLAALLVMTLGCAHPSVVVKQLPSAIVSREREVLPPNAALAEPIGEGENQAYRMGPGDTVLVAVYGHPELSIASYSGGSSATVQSSRSSGLVVDNDGTTQFPLIGSMNVKGMTSDQLRRLLEERLALYVKDPKVTVQVMFSGSIRYYLLGQFVSPGLKYSDRPLRLLEALSLGGSVLLERASLSGAYLARAGKKLPINFNRLIRDGDLTQNVKLIAGDIVFIPDDSAEQAFVFGGGGGGAVSSARGGAVPFRNGRLSLLQALSQAGFGRGELIQAQLAKTLVIRSEGDRGELFVVDAAKILHGDAAPFPLMPGDVVFVPSTSVAVWNQALSQLLPTLQTISGLLNPFVQIKYLSR